MKKLAALALMLGLALAVAVPAVAGTHSIKVGDNFFVKKGGATVSVAKGTKVKWNFSGSTRTTSPSRAGRRSSPRPRAARAASAARSPRRHLQDRLHDPRRDADDAEGLLGHHSADRGSRPEASNASRDDRVAVPAAGGERVRARSRRRRPREAAAKASEAPRRRRGRSSTAGCNGWKFRFTIDQLKRSGPTVIVNAKIELLNGGDDDEAGRSPTRSTTAYTRRSRTAGTKSATSSTASR